MRFEQAKSLTSDEFHRLAAGLKPETRMFIDGELVEARSGGTFETINPADGTVLATVPSAEQEDVDRAVAAARRAFFPAPGRGSSPGPGWRCSTASPT